MNTPAVIDHPAAQPSVAGADLAVVLVRLACFGRVVLGQYSSPGWHCDCDMYTSAQGARFKVASEFGHTTPIAAALQCEERVNAAVRQIAR